MNRFFLALLAIALPYYLFGQHEAVFKVVDSQTSEPLIGATAQLVGSSIGAGALSDGTIILQGVPSGKQSVRFKFIGYTDKSLSLTFPLASPDTIIVALVPHADELEEITITSTRSTRTIEAIPTRVEFIAGEELDEKGNMRPGDIRLVLSESTGIQVQVTSPTSANASIRIQGLDGRYTQILKDGLPLYTGAASGLGLLQIPPLDLQQVEVIKGSAPTLYGGGAIAGLVNLITKAPTEEGETRLLLNGTSAGGLDASAYYGKRDDKVGLTLFAAHNRNTAYDPAGIDLTAIPKFERYTINGRLFLYPGKRTKANIGINTSFEERTGGDMHYVEGKNLSGHGFFEKNSTDRISTQAAVEHTTASGHLLSVKNSYSYFNRRLQIPDYQFEGVQNATFSEISYTRPNEVSEWIVGANLWTDNFADQNRTQGQPLDYSLSTYGLFVQNSWKANDALNLETGLRADKVSGHGMVVLPRLSLLVDVSTAVSTRLGGGFGYKAPTIFTEESERIYFRQLLPVAPATSVLERSYGANWDINYRTELLGDQVTLTVNHLFFYTHLDKPLMLRTGPQFNFSQFFNLDGHITTKGTETNVKLGYGDFKLFLGYTYTDARTFAGSASSLNVLTPKHRINSVLFYEVEEQWKLGLEAYYFSQQQLSDGVGQQYLIMGFMAEKLWERFSIFINFENFLDARQTRFDTIYTGSLAQPNFREIYAPMEGFVVNGGVKVRL